MNKILEELYNRKRGRKLADIDVEEISLVDKPANRRTFAIIKAADPELGELLDGFVDVDAELMDKDSEETHEAIKGALSVLKPYLPAMPDGVTGAVKTLASFTGSVIAGVNNGGQAPEADGSLAAGAEGFGTQKRNSGKKMSGFDDFCFVLRNQLRPVPEQAKALSSYLRKKAGLPEPEDEALKVQKREARAALAVLEGEDHDEDLDGAADDFEKAGGGPKRGVSNAIAGQEDDAPDDGAILKNAGPEENPWPSLCAS